MAHVMPGDSDSGTMRNMAGPTEKYVDTPGSVDSADYQAFLDDYSNQFASGEGQILHGHVLSVSDKEVIVRHRTQDRRISSRDPIPIS